MLDRIWLPGLESTYMAKTPDFVGFPELALASILSGDTVTGQARTGRGGAGRRGLPVSAVPPSIGISLKSTGVP